MEIMFIVDNKSLPSGKNIIQKETNKKKERNKIISKARSLIIKLIKVRVKWVEGFIAICASFNYAFPFVP
uniref:Uncharacterized protein n=1 Tax=Romanomermis culicivorax TaxID=13658 RepID=A0A915I0Y8_ROMCU